MSWEPVSFFPLRALDSASYYAHTLVYEALIRYDASLNVVPCLADSFQISPDRLQYRFHLRPGIKFSSGEAVTVNDVVASIEQAAGPGSPYRADYEDIAGIQVAGERTVVLRLSRVCAPLLSRLVELRILPARFLLLPDHGRKLLSRQPVGTGPFRLRSWQAGSELVFEANPHYWARPPACRQLIWRVVPERTLIALALANGELDVAQIEAAAWKGLPSRKLKQQLVLERFPGARTVYLGFNLRWPPFDNQLVRQAISLAINRKAIAEELYDGFATPARSDFATAGWTFSSKARLWPYDRAACRKTLAQAGFRWLGRRWYQAGAGGRLARSGSTPAPLAFSILTVKDYREVAEAVAADLKAVGIPTEVQLAEFSTLRQRHLQAGQFQTVIWSRSTGPDPDCLLSWHSRGPLNFSRYSSARVDQLLEQGRRQTEPDRRRVVYQEIQQTLSETVPWAFLVHPELLIAHRQAIKNVEMGHQNKTGLPWDNPLFNAANWTKSVD